MRKGFTLIELLVVIALIGILSTLILANLNSARERSRDAQRKSDLRSVQTALRLYYNDYNIYPPVSEINAAWGGVWSKSGVTYMTILPNDPLTSQSYRYTQPGGDTDSYMLETCLENKSDDKCTADLGFCPTSNCKYTVKP